VPYLDNEKEKQMLKTPKLIAFYLPQFHPIPENDTWWGKGFTEWTNVTTSRPLFRGHYQPHLPADLGFYDLRLPEVRQAQADLARAHGIHGFCYYHYWFNGRRLLERPFNDVLASGGPDFPFSLCWANENWTRRWDGRNEDVLVGQNYDHEDDRMHIRSLFNAFEDSRYIRIDGKPLFMVYRTELLPNPRETADIWREESLRAGIGELFLANIHSLGRYGDPRSIGFDASVEFAPDWQLLERTIKGRISHRLKCLIRETGLFSQGANIYDYKKLMLHMLNKQWPDYPFFRCVCPSWDNTARRNKGATVFVNNSPTLYGQWLEKILQMTKLNNSQEPKIVFINAWNEWAEGCHLEPCRKWGRGYLKETQEALQRSFNYA
jgi:lipopolysaccharide biosynthesis protein